ncbi:MAG TPA: sodium:proton exchanger [bacterium]|nr:sodium:proton exchanger [bacterium]
MIVLEASLELNFSRQKIRLILSAFFSALLILLFSVFIVSWILCVALEQSFVRCLPYAVALSIVSSAIVIPSVSHLNSDKKEFIIYESSFSDILGIILFNFLTLEKGPSVLAGLEFIGTLFLVIVISIITSFILFFMLAKIRDHIRIFLLFAILILLYASAKVYHLPSLILILAFGIIINKLVEYKPIKQYFGIEVITHVHGQLHHMTAETAFLIRTFFFILFGYSISLGAFSEVRTYSVGVIITGSLLAIRYFYLRFFLKSRILPELFLMPRGLITVLLLYSLPPNHQLGNFNEGIVLFVILSSSLLMLVGLWSYTGGKLNEDSLTSIEQTYAAKGDLEEIKSNDLAK